MPVTWVLAIAFLLALAFAFRLLFHALRVEGLLRNLMDAVEAQGLDAKDMERALRNVLAAIENGDDLERLNVAIQAARKVVA